MAKFLITKLLLIFCFTEMTYGQNISMNLYKVGDNVDEKYSAFNLVDYQNEQPPFEVKFIGALGELKTICFFRDMGASATMNQEEIHLYLIKNNKIFDQRQEMFGREDHPKFDVFYDIFIQYVEQKHKWVENDAGAMGYDKTDDFTDGLRFVLKDDKLVPLSELSSEDLRIYRNLIFAKYGYVFKSIDLSEYFNNTSWYKPNPKVKINEVMTMRDKELSNYILKLEDKMK